MLDPPVRDKEISRWEHAHHHNARTPNADRRNQIADALGIPRARLYPEHEDDDTLEELTNDELETLL